MSISTLVLIVLAIIVLVIVVIGFTGGWSSLTDRIGNLGGGKANVGLVVQACQIACDSGTQYDYTTLKRDVIFDTKQKSSATCKDLESPRSEGCYVSNTAVANVPESDCKNAAWVDASSSCILTSTDKAKSYTATGVARADCVNAHWDAGWSTPPVQTSCTKF